jgi:cytochrome c oxidase subunit II
MLDMLKWLPENVSTYGADIDHLFYVIYYITGIAFLLVAVGMLAFLIMYRQREGRRATYVHGNTFIEITWTVVTTVIFVVIAFMSQPLWGKVKQQVPPTDIQVRITAKQFNWEIVYPGPDGKFDTADDVTMDNELHVPVNRVVHIFLGSKDVIHSFFVPQLRLKQDAVPGRTIQAWFEATKAGRYEMPCAELCGFGHSGMLGHLTVHSPEEYARWVKQQWPRS